MKKILLSIMFFITSLHAVDSIESWFKEGEIKGNIRYYFIETKKDKPGPSYSSAHSNAAGGTLSYTTASWAGFQTGVTFMTTHGFALPNAVDTSTIGRDNGVRLEGDASGDIAQDSFSVLGEAFVKYSYKDLNALYGRIVIHTPLINAKDVRMLPSAVQGTFVDYAINSNIKISTSYLTHFKQRTSDSFINIVEQALGDQTRTITGDNKGEVILLNGDYKRERVSAKLYNYYVNDFMNSLYVDMHFKDTLDSGYSYQAALQYINQMSVGNADDNLDKNGSLSGGKKISANAFGLKVGMGYQESSLEFDFSKVLSNNDRHDSLVLPWDGTPLFTNAITSNNLFQSNYGKALNADSVYIGGSAGLKFSYTQKYDFTGIKGFKTVLSYLNVNNSKFANNQRDYNAVIGYGYKDFTLALKGIWVRHNSEADTQGNVSQIDKLTQYRVIANYKF